jgi:hypothetical protein
MIRLVATGFALTVATSALALAPTPLHQPASAITQVRHACGPGYAHGERLLQDDCHAPPSPAVFGVGCRACLSQVGLRLCARNFDEVSDDEISRRRSDLFVFDSGS